MRIRSVTRGKGGNYSERVELLRGSFDDIDIDTFTAKGDISHYSLFGKT